MVVVVLFRVIIRRDVSDCWFDDSVQFVSSRAVYSFHFCYSFALCVVWFSVSFVGFVGISCSSLFLLLLMLRLLLSCVLSFLVVSVVFFFFLLICVVPSSHSS